jgi:hypothetical protein
VDGTLTAAEREAAAHLVACVPPVDGTFQEHRFSVTAYSHGFVRGEVFNPNCIAVWLNPAEEGPVLKLVEVGGPDRIGRLVVGHACWSRVRYDRSRRADGGGVIMLFDHLEQVVEDLPAVVVAPRLNPAASITTAAPPEAMFHIPPGTPPHLAAAAMAAATATAPQDGLAKLTDPSAERLLFPDLMDPTPVELPPGMPGCEVFAKTAVEAVPPWMRAWLRSNVSVVAAIVHDRDLLWAQRLEELEAASAPVATLRDILKRNAVVLRAVVATEPKGHPLEYGLALVDAVAAATAAAGANAAEGRNEALRARMGLARTAFEAVVGTTRVGRDLTDLLNAFAAEHHEEKTGMLFVDYLRDLLEEVRTFRDQDPRSG